MPLLVVNGALIKCKFGADPRQLQVVPAPGRTHGGSQPAANIMDILTFTNIPSFITCNCMVNPMVQALTIANGGKLTPAPCIPIVNTPWLSGASNFLVQGLPAVTENSICFCQWAGVINVIKPGQTVIEVGTGAPKDEDQGAAGSVEEGPPHVVTEDVGALGYGDVPAEVHIYHKSDDMSYDKDQGAAAGTSGKGEATQKVTVIVMGRKDSGEDFDDLQGAFVQAQNCGNKGLTDAHGYVTISGIQEPGDIFHVKAKGYRTIDALYSTSSAIDGKGVLDVYLERADRPIPPGTTIDKTTYDTCQLTVLVTDESDPTQKVFVNGAWVRLMGPGGDNQYTDIYGTAVFEKVPAQKIEVFVQKDGYKDAKTVAGPLVKDQMNYVHVVLHPESSPSDPKKIPVLTVFVHQIGLPTVFIAGADVRLDYITEDEDVSYFHTTGKHGFVEFNELTPGNYSLSVAADGYHAWYKELDLELGEGRKHVVEVPLKPE